MNKWATKLEADGIALAHIARKMGVDRSTLWRWARGRIPAERVPHMETVTGFPRHMLRPDLYEKPVEAAE